MITKDLQENIKEYAEKSNLLFRNFHKQFLTIDEEADIESEINALGRLLADEFLLANGWDLADPEDQDHLQWIQKDDNVK